jgi:hypothetical protein
VDRVITLEYKFELQIYDSSCVHPFEDIQADTSNLNSLRYRIFFLQA